MQAKLPNRIIDLNGNASVEAIEAAVSDRHGMLEFDRVLAKTTSSDIAAAKNNTYGQLERFPVKDESIAVFMSNADFIKMTVDCQENDIKLCSIAEH